MDDPEHEPGGLLATGKRILRSVGDLAHNRLELFLVELKEERIRLFDALLLVALCLLCALMTLALVTFTIVMIFWDEHRVLVLVLLTLVYGAGAGASFWSLRNRLRHWQSFAATMEQIKKDRACLEKQK
jgi:uncharacterized membrane protein YqjE